MGKTTPVQDQKKLSSMLTQLKTIKSEMLPEEADTEREEELKNMDDFQKKKHELNTLMSSIREDLRQLDEIRAANAGGRAGQTEITLKANNTRRLQQTKTLLAELENVLEKDKKKNTRKSSKADQSLNNAAQDTQLAKRTQIVSLLHKELVDMQNRNVGVSLRTSSDEKAMEDRHLTRNQREKEERRNARKAGKDARNNTRKSSITGKNKDMTVDIHNEDFRDMKPASEQEQMFADQAIVNIHEQDQLLDQIGDGLDELKEIAIDMNKALKFQNDMIPEIGSKVDHVNKKIDSANQRLEQIFEMNGGMTRWCPMCVCMILLLALVGYIVNMVM